MACSKQDKSTISMSESTLNAIKYTVTAPAKKIYSFDIKDESLKEFELITKLYLNEKLEKEYKLESFRKFVIIGFDINEIKKEIKI